MVGSYNLNFKYLRFFFPDHLVETYLSTLVVYFTIQNWNSINSHFDKIFCLLSLLSNIYLLLKLLELLNNKCIIFYNC